TGTVVLESGTGKASYQCRNPTPKRVQNQHWFLNPGQRRRWSSLVPAPQSGSHSSARALPISPCGSSASGHAPRLRHQGPIRAYLGRSGARAAALAHWLIAALEHEAAANGNTLNREILGLLEPHKKENFKMTDKFRNLWKRPAKPALGRGRVRDGAWTAYM